MVYKFQAMGTDQARGRTQRDQSPFPFMLGNFVKMTCPKTLKEPIAQLPKQGILVPCGTGLLDTSAKVGEKRPKM